MTDANGATIGDDKRRATTQLDEESNSSKRARIDTLATATPTTSIMSESERALQQAAATALAAVQALRAGQAGVTNAMGSMGMGMIGGMTGIANMTLPTIGTVSTTPTPPTTTSIGGPSPSSLMIPQIADDGSHTVRVRGLPWTTTYHDVIAFFRPAVINESDILLITNPQGKATGHYSHSLPLYRSSHIGAQKRYARRGYGYGYGYGGMAGIGIGIGMGMGMGTGMVAGMGMSMGGMVANINDDGTGDAYISFKDEKDNTLALGRTRQMMGHRYIEVFQTTLDERVKAAERNLKMATSVSYNGSDS
jgi:hypothetical protein